MQSLVSIMSYIFGVFKGCLQFLPFKRYFGIQATQYQPLSTNETLTGPSTPLYQLDARRFLQRFNLKYGVKHPIFFVGAQQPAAASANQLSSAPEGAEAQQQQQQQTGSGGSYESVFDEIMDKAKQEYTMALVYIHSDNHQNTPQFCQEVLCTDTLKEYVDANFLFFAADISSNDGYLLSNLLGATSYPFLAVLINLANQKYEVVFKSEGEPCLSLDALVTKLIEAHENTMPRLVVQQHDDNEKVQRRLQREEQDRAYEAVVERDRLRLEQETQRQAELLLQEEARENKKRDKEERIQRIHTERIRIAQNGIPAEPTEKEDSCAIRFRFPDGAQVQRKFHKDSKVQVLYEFVHCLCEMMPEATKWRPHECSELSNYELVFNYPKTVLDPSKTLLESNCFPQAIIFVREENEYMNDELIQEQQ